MRLFLLILVMPFIIGLFAGMFWFSILWSNGQNTMSVTADDADNEPIEHCGNR